MRKTSSALGIALAGVVMGACAGAARPIKYYQIEVPAAAPRPAASNTYPVALLVGRFTAPHLYRDDRIVYRNGPEQLGTYEYHRWAEPPTEMLEDLLLRMLRESGRYQTVQLLRSSARGDYIVRGRLNNLEESDVGRSLTARVAMEVELYEIKSGTTVWSQYYSQDEPVNGKDVPAVVEALDRNVQRGLEQIVGGIDHYFAAHFPK